MDEKDLKIIELRKRIAQLVEENNKHWTLCKDRLPDTDGAYLITYKDEWDYHEVAAADFCGIENGKPIWTTQFEGMVFDDEIIAWMPLPTPCIPKVVSSHE